MKNYKISKLFFMLFFLTFRKEKVTEKKLVGNWIIEKIEGEYFLSRGKDRFAPSEQCSWNSDEDNLYREYFLEGHSASTESRVGSLILGLDDIELNLNFFGTFKMSKKEYLNPKNDIFLRLGKWDKILDKESDPYLLLSAEKESNGIDTENYYDFKKNHIYTIVNQSEDRLKLMRNSHESLNDTKGTIFFDQSIELNLKRIR